jgi:2'-5' RNA ligase
MRLFAGIPLAAAVVDELSAISVRLRSSADGLRWSAPESWHITLQFLGSTGQEQYECTVARLREMRSPSVPIQLEGLGLFERAGVFFAGVSLTPQLLSLQQRVTAATGLCGFIPETTKGKGRTHGLHELKSRIHRQPAFTSFVAEEFVLYESVTRPTGALYEVRERFRLR